MLVWAAESKSLRNYSVVASMSACQVHKVVLRLSPVMSLSLRNSTIPYLGVKAVLDNAITPLTDRDEQGVRPNPNNQKAGQEVTIGVRLARLATTNITDWKLEQQEDPVLYQVVKHRKASRETFKEALLKVTDRKAVSAYAKSKDQLIMKNGLLYQ